MIIKYFLVFLTGLGMTIFLTPRIRKLSLRRNLKRKLIDKKDSRRVHKKVVTKLGGIAIYLAFLVAMGLAFLLERGSAMMEFSTGFMAMLLGGTLIIGLGIYDDIKGADARKKFFVQIIAAFVLILFGFKVVRITNPFSGSIELGFLAIPLTILWIVGMTNAINIIDGVDGLAAGVVSIVCLTLFLVSVPHGNIPLAFLGAALAGATIGFLRYNFSPAKIFMGDTGSMFLGFILAAMAIEGNRKSTVTVALLIPIVALGLPIVDTFLSIVRRLLKGTHIFRADTEHIHHHLLRLGLSHRQVALIFYSITMLLGLIAFACTFLKDRYAATMLAVMALVIVIAVRELGLIKFSLAERAKPQARGKEQGKLASIQLVSTLKKGLKAGAWVAILILVLTMFRLWHNSFDKIDGILARPGEYGEGQVTIIGQLRSSFSVPFIGSAYKIDDGTGMIWVISRLDHAPGHRFLYVEATIEPSLRFEKDLIKKEVWSKVVGSKPLGPILYETERAPIWVSLRSFGKHVAGTLTGPWVKRKE